MSSTARSFPYQWLTTPRRPSGERATPAGFAPVGVSASTRPSEVSTSETESEVWLATSNRVPSLESASATGERCGSPSRVALSPETASGADAIRANATREAIVGRGEG